MSNIIDKIRGIVVSCVREKKSLTGLRHEQIALSDDVIKKYLGVDKLEKRIEALEKLEHKVTVVYGTVKLKHK